MSAIRPLFDERGMPQPLDWQNETNRAKNGMGFELLNRGPVYVVVFVLFMMLVVIQFSFSSSVVSPKLLVRTQRQLEPSDL